MSLTQDRAAVLHRMVIAAFTKGGGLPWSVAPSSLLTATAGRPGPLRLEPFTRALDMGLLPVTYGDVVLDREWGACICSTETVFLALARRLVRAGTIIRRILWLGETRGDPETCATRRRVVDPGRTDGRPGACRAARTECPGHSRRCGPVNPTVRPGEERE